MKQLGDILLEGGLITPAQLSEAFEEHQRAGRSLGRVLVDHGYVTEAQLVAALAAQIGMPFVDLSELTVDGSAIARVPGPVCRRHTAIPFAVEGDKLVVAMADPANVFAIDDIRSVSGMDVRPVVATKPDVMAAIERHYRSDGELDDLSMALEADGDDDDDLVERPGDRRGRADRQVRQPADHPGDRTTEPPTSTSSRPSTTCGCGTASTACCTRSCARPEADPVRRHQPAQDHGRHQHRRAAHPAGRSAVGDRRRARRSTCAWRRSPRCGARRSSCESWTTPRPGWTWPTWVSRRRTSSATRPRTSSPTG